MASQLRNNGESGNPQLITIFLNANEIAEFRKFLDTGKEERILVTYRVRVFNQHSAPLIVFPRIYI